MYCTIERTPFRIDVIQSGEMFIPDLALIDVHRTIHFHKPSARPSCRSFRSKANRFRSWEHVEVENENSTPIGPSTLPCALV
jgi:hypothetical protein